MKKYKLIKEEILDDNITGEEAIKPVTVLRLKQVLEKMNDDDIVVISIDHEGDSYSQLLEQDMDVMTFEYAKDYMNLDKINHCKNILKFTHGYSTLN